MPEKKYPEYIYQSVRRNLGYAEDETKADDAIDKMSRTEVLNRVAAWHNLIGGWAPEIQGWIEGIYNIKLED